MLLDEDGYEVIVGVVVVVVVVAEVKAVESIDFGG